MSVRASLWTARATFRTTSAPHTCAASDVTVALASSKSESGISAASPAPASTITSWVCASLLGRPRDERDATLAHRPSP